MSEHLTFPEASARTHADHIQFGFMPGFPQLFRTCIHYSRSFPKCQVEMSDVSESETWYQTFETPRVDQSVNRLEAPVHRLHVFGQIDTKARSLLFQL